MAQSNQRSSSSSQPEVLKPHENIHEVQTETVSLKTAADVMGTPEAILLSQENLEKNKEGLTLLKANLISLLNKLLRINPSLDVKNISLESFPQKIRENQENIALTKEEIIALSRLESSPAIQAALKNSWEQIQNEVMEGAGIAKEAQEGKPIHEKIINAFKEDPVKAVAYTAIGVGAIYAGWKIFKWAFGEKKEDETKMGATGKFALGGIALATLGFLIGPKKIMEWLPDLSGLKAGFEKTKAIAVALAAGEFTKAYELWTSDEDPKEDLHNSYAKFIEEKTNQKINSKVFRVFGAQSYSKFKEDVSSNRLTEALKAGREAIGDLIAGGMSMTAILGMSNKEVRIQAVRVAEFLENEVESSTDFDGKTLDEVMALIQANPEKYLKTKEGKAENQETKTPSVETIGGTMEIAYENTLEDFSKLLGDLKETVKELPGSEALFNEYAQKIEALSKEDGIFVEASILTEKMNLTRKLLALMFKEGWTVGLEGGRVIAWNGVKIITHRSWDALTKPIYYLFKYDAETALNSYAANVGSLLVLGGSAGAITGMITGSGMIKGGLKGAAKAAILPLTLARKAPMTLFYVKNASEYAHLIQEEVELAGKYIEKYRRTRPMKGIALIGIKEANRLTIKAWDYEYRQELRKVIENKIDFLDKAEGLVPLSSKSKIIAEKNKLLQELDQLINLTRLDFNYKVATRESVISKLEKQNPETAKVLRTQGSKFDSLLRTVEKEPKSKWAKFIISNPKAIEQIAKDPELVKKLASPSFLAAFEEETFSRRVSDLFSSGKPAEAILKELDDYAEKIKVGFAGKGEIKLERFLETDPKMIEIHQKMSTELTSLQSKGAQVQEKIKVSIQAAKSSPEVFFKTTEGLVLKAELDGINTLIEKTTLDYSKNIALHLSEGATDDLNKLPKKLKKRALEFIVEKAGAEIQMTERLTGKLIKRVGNNLIILAPLIAIKAYAHGSREGLGGEIGSAAVSMTPVLGTLADFYSAATGKDYISGADVGRLESLGWAVTGVACDALVLVGGAGMGARLVLKGARTAGKAGRIAKAAETTTEAIKASKNLTRLTKAGAVGSAGMMGFTVGSAAYEWVTEPKEVLVISSPQNTPNTGS